MTEMNVNAGTETKPTHRAVRRKASRTAKTSDVTLAPLNEQGHQTTFEALSPGEKNAIFRDVGEELARTLGAQVIAQMLKETPLSGREIGARLGFDHTALSRIARGESKTGPTLWKLYALAEALGYRIELNAIKK
ncbi:MAG: hypothetical protein R8G34_07355 [Paracoccaceae bacterium]|nr:hypothetical protein [Paracoccaceae bacterium]